MKKSADPAPINLPNLDDYEPYLEPAETIARYETKEIELAAEERRLSDDLDRLAAQLPARKAKLDLDALDAVLAGDVAPSSPLEAAQLDLANVRRKVVVVRRAIEEFRIDDLGRAVNAASNHLLPPLTDDYRALRRRVVFAVCEMSDGNERLWEMGDELTNRGFAWQHILPPGRMFQRPMLNLGTSASAASQFIIAEVADGVVCVDEIEKFIRSDVLLEALRTAEKSRSEMEKTA